MAGRSIMVALAIGAIALAASAGCAGPTELSSADAYVPASPTTVSAPVAPESPQLAMALATDEAAAGPTAPFAEPLAPAQAAIADAPLRGFTSEPGDEASGGDRGLTLSVRVATERPYGPSTALVALPGTGGWRPLEVSIAGPAGDDFQFQMSHRTGAQEDNTGAAQTSGTELRIGQRLLSGAHKFQSPDSWTRPAWYLFAASDGQALIYTPTTDPFSPNRNFTTENRVNIGSITAGLSMEAHGMQASFSYVKREVTTLSVEREERTADQDFAGLTLTWRR